MTQPKPDMTKAREMLAVAAGPLGKGTGCNDIQAIVPLYDAIKAIIDAIDPPKPEKFDWATVKPGMAFNFANSVYHYVGIDYEGDVVFVCPAEVEQLYDGFHMDTVKKCFKRIPDYDKVMP